MTILCRVEFVDNPKRVYYAGQKLRGRVRLSLTNPLLVRGIFVEVSGQASCKWFKGTGANKREYSGHETYLNLCKYLLGSQGGNYTHTHYTILLL